MPAIDLTPAQVNTELARERTETRQVVVRAPPLDDVRSVTFFRADASAPNPGQQLCTVEWDGRAPVTFPVNDALPVGERAGLRVGLGRCLIHARELVGAT